MTDQEIGQLSIHFDILTLFPEMFAGVFNASIIARAQEMGKVKHWLKAVIRAY